MALSPGWQQLVAVVPQQRPMLVCWWEPWKLRPVASHSLMLCLYFTLTIHLAKVWQLVCIVTCGHNMTIIPMDCL